MGQVAEMLLDVGAVELLDAFHLHRAGPGGKRQMGHTLRVHIEVIAVQHTCIF